MKTLLGILCALSLGWSVLPVTAAVTPHFFVGANAQWNEPTGDFGDASDEVEKDLWKGNAAGVFGGQADAGIISDNGQVYVGYRIVNFDEKQSDGNVEWRNNSRWIFGLRWHALGSLESPLMPILGGGASVGKTEGIFKQPGPGDEIIAELTSDYTWGWFLEGGAALRVPETPLSFNAMLQYQRYTAKFDSDDLDVEFKIGYITYQIGAQIMFQ